MTGVEISVAVAAVMAGFSSAARGQGRRAPRWRLRLAVAVDIVNLAAAVLVAVLWPEALFATPILLVAAFSLGDWALAVLQLRGEAGHEPPEWLV